uniref:Kinesin-like protein n=1 Tax=Panagrellus redivivus TaxID=6233 RepID=A0A7E4VTZ3_PANRE
MEVEDLRRQIVKLTEELEKAEDDNNKAGELGMAIFKEKEQLEFRLGELQEQYESLRIEADTTKKAFELFKAQHKAAAHNEIDHEERLLSETAAREDEYQKKISALEAEIKILQPELQRNKVELERLQAEIAKNTHTIDDLENQRRQLRDEIKELKQRDQALQNDNMDLEETNVALEKTVSSLKQGQIEMEALKMEVKRLCKENADLTELKADTEHILAYAQRQNQELHDKNQLEREEKLALKRELEHMRNAEQLSHLNSLLVGMESENLRQMENSFVSDGTIDTHFGTTPASGSDLFSEIHGGLNENVSRLEQEKEALAKQMEELKSSYVKMALPLLSQLNINGYENMDIEEIKELFELAQERLRDKMESGKLDKVTEKLFEQQKSDLRTAIMFAGANHAKVAAMRDQMLLLGNLLSQSHTEIVGKENISDKVTQIMQNLHEIAKENAESSNQETEEGEDSRETTRSPRLLAIDPINHAVLADSFLKEISPKLSSVDKIESLFSESDFREKLVENEDTGKLVKNLQELVDVVRCAVDTSIQQQLKNIDVNAAEMLAENQKLKHSLNVKRDQVKTLRHVLSKNKTSTEEAMASVREKFESEKQIKDEHVATLRSELKQFKEDAATFASHRAMYTARCEEYQEQVESLKESLKTAEEEKKTLNQLLRMAIQQKLSLTQRLEDLEMDRERQNYKRPTKQAPPPRNENIKAHRYPSSNTNQQSPQPRSNNNSK